MKKNETIVMRICVGLFTIFSTISCTDLDNTPSDGSIQSASEGGTVDAAAFLVAAQNGLRGFQDQDKMFAMDEMTSDALAGPTRGGDWDDNGKWRQLHNHTWDASHVEIRNAWNALLSNVYNCNQVVENSSSAADIANARFLRAFYYYHMVDLFGQAPYRPAGSDPNDYPLVYTRTEATDFVISELEAVLPVVADRVSGDPSIISKDAVRFLLAKVYLNKGVFTAAAPEGPYNFSTEDMNKVVSNVDAITNTLVANYWDNFSPTNNNSDELVFTSKNTLGNGGGIQSRWRMCQHYNATPGGWNGFSTVADYYDRFNPNDARIKYSTPYIISNYGNNVGFLIGQQFAPGGTVPLKDRKNNPLSFTKELNLVVSGNAIETAGIRGLKYIPDADNIGAPEDDYVLMRYSDALLMKAEAIARGGSGSVGTIMTDLATRAGVTPSAATLEGIYEERGRELWWEGYRRNDMVRFGKFLEARDLKPYVSDNKFLLFPIPAGALLNPNITQNPGY